MNDKTLIRFDWAMKRLLRNKANFSVLEGFLSELLKDDIKINKILESEGNKENPEDKFNRVDLLAENTRGSLFIIEVQNQTELDYFHRMSYGTAKVLSEYLDEKQAYEEIKKIFSVNIVYFDLGQGKDYVYKGTTDFWGLHKNDKLMLSERQSFKYKKLEPNEIFPEYYLLKVNQFDDVAKDTLDEWIYYFKNNEIRDEFNAKGLDKVRTILKYDQLSESEKLEYRRHVENLRYKASILSTLKAEEEFEIHQKGKAEGKAEMIRNGHSQGLSVEILMKISGLTKDEIEKIIMHNPLE
jgi:predicted transposase/invertase (TIGR01784 family)